MDCVVRTYKNGYTKTTQGLQEKLSNGWVVKMATPYIIGGDVEYVEYILSKDN